MKKYFIFVLTILTVGVLILKYKGFFGLKKAQEIKTAKVLKKDILRSVSASGKVASGKEVELKFQTSGQLVWVGVKLGDTVKPWQAIAQLDKRELELNLQKYLRDYSKERWDFEEDKQVTYRDKVLTDTIKRILEKNQFDLDKAVMDVELKDIALKFATLVTPIGGVVTQIDTPLPGVNITPATAVFKISDPNDLVFKADVDETDIARVKEGQEAEIKFDAYPEETYRGNISRIDFVAKSTSGGGTAFNVEVKILKNPNLKYKLGMNADINIIEEKKNGILVVPVEAVQGKGKEKFVYLLEKNQPVKRKISAGLETDTEVEIIKGLAEGQSVLLSGF